MSSNTRRGSPERIRFRGGRVSVDGVDEGEYNCKWPNAKKLVSQLYEVCLREAQCFANLGGNGKCIAELNSEYSYVSFELKNFITSENFRKRFAFDGDNLVANTNSYILIGPKHDVTTTHGLENIDDKFPDPFYKEKQEITCPKVDCTTDNCYCQCRPDNCNEKPVRPGPPAIVTMGLQDFREGKILNFVDPFKGQHRYEVTEDGRVRNADGSYTMYMHPKGWMAPIKREYLDGDAVVIPDICR